MSAPTADTAWRALLSHGHIPQAVPGARAAQKAAAIFLRSIGNPDLEQERRGLTAARLMVAAAVQDYPRAQAAYAADQRRRLRAQIELLAALRAQGIKTSEDDATASRTAIRGRPTRCSSSARRAALVGCSAACAPPSRTCSQLHEVSHE